MYKSEIYVLNLSTYAWVRLDVKCHIIVRETPSLVRIEPFCFMVFAGSTRNKECLIDLCCLDLSMVGRATPQGLGAVHQGMGAVPLDRNCKRIDKATLKTLKNAGTLCTRSTHCAMQCGATLKKSHHPLPRAVWQCTKGLPPFIQQQLLGYPQSRSCAG